MIKLLERFGYMVLLLVILGTASGYVQHELTGADAALARADTAATRATAAALRQQKRAQLRVAQALAAKRTSDSVVARSREYSARFSPSHRRGQLTYTAPSQLPREIPIAPEVQLRIEYLEASVSSQAHTIASDSVAIASLQATVDSTEGARAAEANLAHEEHKAARRAWWRGLGAGMKTTVVVAVTVVTAVVVARHR